MIKRDMSNVLKQALGEYPIVSVSGPRQCGKTTLLRSELPDWDYVSLENPDMRRLATDDPRAFLRHRRRHVILDEIQRAPELLSYLQGIVDETGEPGQFAISGSQNYLLMRGVTQTLAGRVALVDMGTLSRHELLGAAPANLSVPEKGAAALGAVQADRWEWVVRGGYPRVYDYGITSDRYYADYMRTYLERDVRGEFGVIKLLDFERFMGVCASRTGELLNYSALASDTGVDVKTAKGWLSALEAGGILFEIRPHFSNAGKRFTKSPKLYFSDTGLVCHLLGIRTGEEALVYAKSGNLFETAVVAEYLRCVRAAGERPNVTYYRRGGSEKEVDIVVERGLEPWCAFEVKSSSTYRAKFFSNIADLADELGVPEDRRGVIYNGEEGSATNRQGLLLTPDDLPSLADGSVFALRARDR